MYVKSIDSSIVGGVPFDGNTTVASLASGETITTDDFKNDPIHDMISEITGKTAIEIVNTLIRENYISSLQHAADMGIELQKAELSLKYGFKYIQDKDLIIDK